MILTTYILYIGLTLVIHNDQGGIIKHYVDKYQKLSDKNGSIIIDGPCISACTTFATIIPKDKICSTEKGILGFHSAFIGLSPRYTKDGTILMNSYWTESMKKAIINKGWDGISEHPLFIIIPATKFYKKCT